jgi:hypothetical protein
MSEQIRSDGNSSFERNFERFLVMRPVALIAIGIVSTDFSLYISLNSIVRSLYLAIFSDSAFVILWSAGCVMSMKKAVLLFC